MRNRILNDFSEEKDKLYRVKFNHYNEELDIEEDVYIVMTQGKLLTLIILAEPFQKYDVEFDSAKIIRVNTLPRVITIYTSSSISNSPP